MDRFIYKACKSQQCKFLDWVKGTDSFVKSYHFNHDIFDFAPHNKYYKFHHSKEMNKCGNEIFVLQSRMVELMGMLVIKPYLLM